MLGLLFKLVMISNPDYLSPSGPLKPFKITIITKITRATKHVQFADVRFTQARVCTMVADLFTVRVEV
jgi:hypothetical protein